MTVLIRAIAVAFTLAAPAAAQEEAPTASDDIQEGMDKLSDGARTLLRGLMGEVDPNMRGLAERFRDWDFDGLSAEDLGRYHPPEMLPNGDIIIRRKTPKDDGDPMDDEVDI